MEIGATTAEKNNGHHPRMEMRRRYGYKIRFLQYNKVIATEASYEM